MVAAYPYQTDKRRLETVASLRLDLLGTLQVVTVARLQPRHYKYILNTVCCKHTKCSKRDIF
jgi:hypothetical protein